jgi:hypothetical protein
MFDTSKASMPAFGPLFVIFGVLGLVSVKKGCSVLPGGLLHQLPGLRCDDHIRRSLGSGDDLRFVSVEIHNLDELSSL